MLITFADSPSQSGLEVPTYREIHERKFPSEKSDGKGKCVETNITIQKGRQNKVKHV